VLADSLQKICMNCEWRNRLRDGQLLLISSCAPGGGLNVGHAM